MQNEIKFTVSSRQLSSFNIYKELTTSFENLNIGKIDQVSSVFGFVKEFSSLYGGRPYRKTNCISYRKVNQLKKHGIGMSLTLSNHYFDEDKYKQTIPILEKLYHKGNSIICTNDQLALRIRKDFPGYILKASVIKAVSNLDEIYKTLEIYDYIALLPKLNDEIELLQSIDCKDKVILFASVKCLYHCDASKCFRNTSDKMAKYGDKTPFCKHPGNKEIKKLNIFNLSEERFKGFSMFKVVLE